MKNKGILEIFTRVTSKQLSFILPKTNKLKAKINILDLVHKTSNKGMRIPQQHKTSTEQESPQFQSKPNRKEQAHLKTQSITSTTLPNIKTGNTWPEKKKKRGGRGSSYRFLHKYMHLSHYWKEQSVVSKEQNTAKMETLTWKRY